LSSAAKIGAVSQFKHEEKFIRNAACPDALIGEYFD
jgi:hypothetical protein